MQTKHIAAEWAQFPRVMLRAAGTASRSGVTRAWDCCGQARLVRAGLAIAILVFAGMWATSEEVKLRAREHPNARLPYRSDATLPDLPVRLTKRDLLALCPEGPNQPVVCLDDGPQVPSNVNALLAVEEGFRSAIEGQLAAAAEINALVVLPADAGKLRSGGQVMPGTGSELPRLLGEEHVLESTKSWSAESRGTYPMKLQNQLHRSAARTQAAMEEIRARAERAETVAARWRATRDLGLLAAGLAIRYDFGQHPPSPILVAQRGSLADEIERLRRARVNASEHDVDWCFDTALAGILTAGAVAVVIAIALNTGPILAALATASLAASWLMLADLGLTGPIPLRHLPVIQFTPLMADLGVIKLPLFPPLLAFGIALALIRLSYDARTGWIWWPAERWVSTGSPLASSLSGIALLAGAAGLVLTTGYSAGVSELLIGIGALGIGTFVARHAGLVSIGIRHGWYTLPVLLLGVAAAIAGSLARGDLGHACVALALFSVFLVLFLPTLVAILLALIVFGGVTLIAGFPDNPTSSLIPFVHSLERVAPHAAERFHVLGDPFAHGTSDFARLFWLRSVSGPEGWGMGQVPWAGLSGAKVSDGLPLQAPSDYILAVAEAIWGRASAWILLGGVSAIFTLGAAKGLRTALEGGTDFVPRLVAATGAFGCMAVLVRAMLSAAGTAGAAPITGVPIALLSYAPAATWSSLGYLALVYSLPPRNETS